MSLTLVLIPVLALGILGPVAAGLYLAVVLPRRAAGNPPVR